MPSAFRGNTAFAHSALLASGLAVIPLSVSAQQPPAARRGVDSILYVEDRGTVSIGDRIRYGQRRFTWTGSTAADDSLQVVLSTETRLSRTAFLEQVQSRLAGLPPNSAFLYVHGYWNGRDDAMQRAAEFKRLVTYPGPAIVFRWPSSDRPDYYTVDREAAWRSRQPLATLIADLRSVTPLDRLHIIGHSMGGQVVADAFAVRQTIAPGAVRVHGVTLLAPDIDRDEFVTRTVPLLSRFTDRLTLYASARDLALRASGKLPFRKTRAGFIPRGSGIVMAENLISIDASAVTLPFGIRQLSQSSIGHSDHLRQAAARDLYHVVLQGLPVECHEFFGFARRLRGFFELRDSVPAPGTPLPASPACPPG